MLPIFIITLLQASVVKRTPTHTLTHTRQIAGQCQIYGKRLIADTVDESTMTLAETMSS